MFLKKNKILRRNLNLLPFILDRGSIYIYIYIYQELVGEPLYIYIYYTLYRVHTTPYIGVAPHGALPDSRDPRDYRDSRNSRDPRVPRDSGESRDSRELKDTKEPEEPRDSRDPSDSKEPRDPRDPTYPWCFLGSLPLQRGFDWNFHEKLC